MKRVHYSVAIIILVGLLTINHTAFAQQEKTKKDSTDIYKNIESFFNYNKLTRTLHKMIFIDVDSTGNVKNVPRQRSFTLHDGKVIRKIIIQTLDPLGYAINDTTRLPENFLARLGNRIHIKSRNATIKDLLLFRENTFFDAVIVNESERLVRSRRYITDVIFTVEPVAGSPDSVDIHIRSLDKWSIYPGGSVSSPRIDANITDNNFLGLGHEFQYGYTWNHTSGNFATRTRYFIPNISKTYTNSTVHYGRDEWGNVLKSFSVDRPFFSAYARWAGGFNFSQILKTDSLWSPDYSKYKYNSQELWAGHAFQLHEGTSEYRRSTNLITAARYYRVRYLQKPDASLDTLSYYSNENFYLALVGISSRQYLRDSYIFKFGLTEDVPIGYIINLTAGYQQRSDKNRLYLATHFSKGDYYSWGYLGSYLEYGTFIHSSKAEQGVLGAGINYHTGLLEFGRWRARQFFKPSVTIGLNRQFYDTLTINRDQGLIGFSSPTLSGNSRLLFTWQTQLYAPWEFIGFHFGPYITYTLGMLGDTGTPLLRSKIYPKIGVGVLIKNDNLVMNTFQISISYYPTIPGVGNHLFRFNTYNTDDYGYRTYELGKPEPIRFR